MTQEQVKIQPIDAEKDELLNSINDNAARSGYFLNPDREFNLFLMNGLLVNEGRYGYQSCPCRLSSGNIDLDRDIICPCDYRDDDLAEYGMCYCSLYVTQEVLEGKKETRSIPERRKISGSIIKSGNEKSSPGQPLPGDGKYPVWRCKVCGYLCARNSPPELCPICKAAKERFEIFII